MRNDKFLLIEDLPGQLGNGRQLLGELLRLGLHQLHIHTMKQAPGCQWALDLSTGQSKRLGLARAMYWSRKSSSWMSPPLPLIRRIRRSSKRLS